MSDFSFEFGNGYHPLAVPPGPSQLMPPLQHTPLPQPAPSHLSFESLQLADLMKNAAVNDLHAKYMEASERVIRNSDIQQKLWEENALLKAELAQSGLKYQAGPMKRRCVGTMYDRLTSYLQFSIVHRTVPLVVDQ
jgi:hypothetical protein